MTHIEVLDKSSELAKLAFDEGDDEKSPRSRAAELLDYLENNDFTPDSVQVAEGKVIIMWAIELPTLKLTADIEFEGEEISASFIPYWPEADDKWYPDGTKEIPLEIWEVEEAFPYLNTLATLKKLLLLE